MLRFSVRLGFPLALTVRTPRRSPRRRRAAELLRPIALAVDASDAPRRIFHVRESLPAPAGTLTLVYPKWIPGEHGPTGPITDLVGLKVSSGGKPSRVDGACRPRCGASPSRFRPARRHARCRLRLRRRR